MHEAFRLKFVTLYLLVALLLIMFDFESLKLIGVPAALKLCLITYQRRLE